MKKRVKAYILVGIIAALLFIILFGMIANIKEENDIKSSENTTKLSKAASNTNTSINPAKIIEKINRNELEEANKIFEQERENWNQSSKDTEKLDKYFQDYFEIRYALEFCLKNDKKIKDVKNYRKFKKSNDEQYKSNRYLTGEKKLDDGIDNFIKDIDNLEDWLRKKGLKVQAEIPTYDILKNLYLYNIKFKEKNNHFIEATKKYEDFLIINRHERALTRKDATVLCMREHYALTEAAVKNENVRKKKCLAIINDINTLTTFYPNYIGENGTFKDVYEYLNIIRNECNELITAQGNFLMFPAQPTKQIKDAQKKFTDIPGL